MTTLIIGLLIPLLGTMLGSAFVFFMKDEMSIRLQKTLLGFASGVMVAASVWSLLIPSMEMVEDSGNWSVVPAAVGFLLGMGFLLMIDELTPHLHIGTDKPEGMRSHLSKTVMLALAVTIHNLPEGMAVGVVFAGAENGISNISLASAVAVALGIAIQNVPEGAIISMPMRAAGNTKWKSFVIGSLSGILGPSPEERAAEEQKLQEHRQKMHGWTALFNGLRHLSNLYYATKGAPGQKYSDPHQLIEQQYQDERRRLAEIHAADQKYYANLWGLYRQMNDEQRRNTLAEAQAQYYGTRDEMARQKAELDKLKAVRVIKQKDGSLMKFDPVSGELEPLSEADPLYVEYMRSQINKNNRTGTGRSTSSYSWRLPGPSVPIRLSRRIQEETCRLVNITTYGKYQ